MRYTGVIMNAHIRPRIFPRRFSCRRARRASTAPRPVALGALLGAILLLAGCPRGEVLQSRCTSIADCPVGQTCHDGVCMRSGDTGPFAGDGQHLALDHGAPWADLGYCASGVVCGAPPECCHTGDICIYGVCAWDQGPCKSDTDCLNDSYCLGGKCVPWGHGPRGDRNKACTHLSPIGQFSPARQCSWTAPPAGDKFPKHINVLGTPMVADFDFDNNKKAVKPSVVFVSYDNDDGGAQAARCDGAYHGVIRIIDGATCKQQFSLDTAKVRAATSVAIGDINLDGRPDIVANRCGGGLVALTYDAKAKQWSVLWRTASKYLGTSSMWDGPALHDLDNDGKPEVLMRYAVFSNKGVLRDIISGAPSYGSGYIPVAADINGDGLVELANGQSVWQWKGGKWVRWQHNAANAVGQVAVADFGTYGASAAGDRRGKRDGVAEIAVVSNGTVRVQTAAGRVIYGPVKIPAGGMGGAPTVGDFDHDGRAEVAAASHDSYSVFDPDCVAGASKSVCASGATGGILWSKGSQDHSSSVTGSSIFDFEGDGAAEAVYSDECFTRVYDGKTGEVLYSQWRTSCTWYENPVVADVDGDYNSELVVPSNKNCNIYVKCQKNPKHPKHPVTGVTLDPLFRGLRCKAAADCRSAHCVSGFCRCTTDKACGKATDGFVCGPPVSGTPGTGNVCRAAFKGAASGVFIYRDVLDRWVSSRFIWNQHTYSVTNVTEDGTIPRTQKWTQNWKVAGLNNFRQNKQGSLNPQSSPDLTAGPRTASSVVPKLPYPCDKLGNLTLSVKLCNRGTQPVGVGVPVTFYLGKPAYKQVLCTARNKARIDPGSCEKVSCVWKGAPFNKSMEVYARADDDGTGKGTTNECQEGNNLALLKGVECKKLN